MTVWTFSDPTITEPEAGIVRAAFDVTINFNRRLDKVFVGAPAVYTTVDDTAEAGLDYFAAEERPLDYSVEQIAQYRWVGTATAYVDILFDGLREGPEDFSIEFRWENGRYLLATKRVTIDDTPPSGLIYGTTADDDLTGTAGPDRIDLLAGDDVYNARGGDDLVLGNIGDDRILGRAGNDKLDGGPGDDRVFGGTGDDDIAGSDGDDLLVGKAGDDLIRGGAGNDVLRGLDGADTFEGGTGNDTVWGGAGNDVIRGQKGDDALGGGGGDDSIEGGTGNDLLMGGDGNDTLDGQAGDDVVRGGNGDDVLDGGAGNDLLFGGDGDDVLVAGYVEGDRDVLDGGAGNDILHGSRGSTVQRGRDGDDILDGSSFGDDRLFGGPGNDRLEGHAGADHLFGGPGDDLFIFQRRQDQALKDYAGDVVHGFDGAGEAGGDLLVIDAYPRFDVRSGKGYFFHGELSSEEAFAKGGRAMWVEDIGEETWVFADVDKKAGEILFAIRIIDGVNVSASDYTADDFLF